MENVNGQIVVDMPNKDDDVVQLEPIQPVDLAPAEHGQDLKSITVKISCNQSAYNIHGKRLHSAASGSGSGFFVLTPQGPRIVTCMHVVDSTEPDSVLITSPCLTDQHFAAHVEAVFPHHDLAILRVTDSNAAKLFEIATFPKLVPMPHVRGLTKVFAVPGFPLDLGYTPVKTNVTLTAMPQGVALQMDGAINAGHSGSAVVDISEENYVVVGMANSKIVGDSVTGVAFGLSCQYIIEDIMKACCMRWNCDAKTWVSANSDSDGDSDATVVFKNPDLGVATYGGYTDRFKALGFPEATGIIIKSRYPESPVPDHVVAITGIEINGEMRDIANNSNVHTKDGSMPQPLGAIISQRAEVTFRCVCLASNKDEPKYEQKNLTIPVNWVGQNGFEFRHFPFEKLDTLQFGFLFCPLVNNSMESFPIPFACTSPEKLAFPMIMVIESSDNNGLKDINEKIQPGQLIYSINNITVKTLEDAVEAFKNPVLKMDEYYYIFKLRNYDIPGPELPVSLKAFIKVVESETKKSDNVHDPRVNDIMDHVKKLLESSNKK